MAVARGAGRSALQHERTDGELTDQRYRTPGSRSGMARSSSRYWFWGRPSFYDLWHDLRDLSREIRPDWDLDTPGLCEAWEADDLAAFHGWNRWDAGKLIAAGKPQSPAALTHGRR